ncbi:MAG: class Ib ribonucleoside-diphosphate reductase assembly flavoprotein NrdI [Clostridiales bacterium]|nr:class Ib ribonucleoside-diphosphate reductase assembly flavoprotein NrdI [Clostridiales bacterium]
MYLIVYDSRSGKGKKFAEKLSSGARSVADGADGDCILITRNEGLGKISKATKTFLKSYSGFVKGVVVNGDKRFGRFFCAAGLKIEKEYGIKVIRNIEGEGTEADAAFVKAFLENEG